MEVDGVQNDTLMVRRPGASTWAARTLPGVSCSYQNDNRSVAFLLLCITSPVAFENLRAVVDSDRVFLSGSQGFTQPCSLV